MDSLVLEVSNPVMVHAIAEAARLQGTTPEICALELLETALLASQSFEDVVEPVAQSFDESGAGEDELESLIEQAKQAVRRERRQSN
jgi:hypothetical protein